MALSADGSASVQETGERVRCDTATNTDLARAIRARSDEDADARLGVHQFVHDHLDEIVGRGEVDRGPALATAPIWIYWAQGDCTPPPIVSACLKQLRRTNPASTITLLDDRNIADHIDLPSCVYDKIFDNKTHFSDILRVSLLSRYGGIWVDATCLCTTGLHEFVDARLDGGFLAYARNYQDQYMFSSWFMAAKPGAAVPTLLRDALYTYWRVKDSLDHYFLLHFLFEALYNLDARFRDQWCRRAELNAYDAHRLQHCLFDPFAPDHWNDVLALSAVHKLTYKLDRCPAPGSFYEHILGL